MVWEQQIVVEHLMHMMQLKVLLHLVIKEQELEYMELTIMLFETDKMELYKTVQNMMMVNYHLIHNMLFPVVN
jgi:hypothetical protein